MLVGLMSSRTVPGHTDESELSIGALPREIGAKIELSLRNLVKGIYAYLDARSSTSSHFA